MACSTLLYGDAFAAAGAAAAAAATKRGDVSLANPYYYHAETLHGGGADSVQVECDKRRKNENPDPLVRVR